MFGITNKKQIKEAIKSYRYQINKISREIDEERGYEDCNKKKIAMLNGYKSGLYRRMRREVRSLIVENITMGKKYSIFSVQKMYQELFGVSMNRDYLHEKFDFDLPPGGGRATDVVILNDNQKSDINDILKLI